MITVVNSQGTKIWIAPKPNPMWTECFEAVDGLIDSGKMVGCPQSITDLSETREVTEYLCLSSSDSAKALGSVSRASLEIEMLLDPEDIAGQQALRQAFRDNSTIAVGIEYGESDVLVWFLAQVSQVSTGIAQDEAITYTATLEVSSVITECKTTAIDCETESIGGLDGTTFLMVGLWGPQCTMFAA